MADAGVSLDMFTPLDNLLAFSVDRASATAAAALLHGDGLSFSQDDGLAKVTLVGAGMHGVPGIMARIAQSLSDARIDILQVADSHYTISVLIDGSDVARAISCLHEEFALGVE
jgi:aspartate kinase